MNKNLMLLPLIFASSMTVSLSAFATKGAAYVAPAPTNDSYYHSGFYLGGAIGGNQYFANIENFSTGTYVGWDLDLDYTIGSYDSLESESKSAGFMGQVQLGYAYINDWFFGALEISGNGSTGSNGMDQDNAYSDFNFNEGTFGVLRSDVDVELNSWEPVVDLKIGFKVTPNSLLYARVGAAFNEITVKNKLNLELDYYFDEQVLSSHETTKSDSVVGLRLGVGAEQRFSENLAVSLDYVYTDYGSVDVSGSGQSAFWNSVPDPEEIDYLENGLKSDSEVNVKRNVVMLGMNYYF
jgi:opacity protein-like surface antigen